MVELSDFIQKRFPEDMRIVASPRFLNGVSLPEPYKDFLERVGCPTSKELCINLDYIRDGVKRLWECGLSGMRSASIRGLVCAGINDNDVAFAIEEESGGTLWEVDLNVAGKPVYMNKGIPELAGFLAYYDEYCFDYGKWEQRVGEQAKIEDFRQRYYKLVSDLSGLDERALEQGNWWYWIIQELSIEIGD